MDSNQHTVEEVQKNRCMIFKIKYCPYSYYNISFPLFFSHSTVFSFSFSFSFQFLFIIVLSLSYCLVKLFWQKDWFMPLCMKNLPFEDSSQFLYSLSIKSEFPLTNHQPGPYFLLTSRSLTFNNLPSTYLSAIDHFSAFFFWSKLLLFLD